LRVDFEELGAHEGPHGALADGDRAALDRAGADVARGIDAGDGGFEQPLGAERRDRLFRKRRVAIDAGRPRRKLPFGDCGSGRGDLLLFVIQSIHCQSPLN